MGYLVELNTLLGVPKDFNVTTLSVGKRFTVTKDRERAFPLHIAMLIVDASWNFYGYCVVHSAKTFDHKTQLEFEVLMLFNQEEQQIYKNNFMKVGTMTGEIK